MMKWLLLAATIMLVSSQTGPLKKPRSGCEYLARDACLSPQCHWDPTEGNGLGKCEEGEEGIEALEVEEGCENWGADLCDTKTGKGGHSCHYVNVEEECKESDCEHYTLDGEDKCVSSVGEHGVACVWEMDEIKSGLSQTGKCKEASEVDQHEPGELPEEINNRTQANSTQAGDGCEEMTKEACPLAKGESGMPCHWVVQEDKEECKEADCEHHILEAYCTGTGEHGGACVWLASEGCKESIAGVTGGETPEAPEVKCEGLPEATCNLATSVGENGLQCQYSLSEGCKESTTLRKPHQQTSGTTVQTEDQAEAASEAAEDHAEMQEELAEGEQGEEPEEPEEEYYTQTGVPVLRKTHDSTKTSSKTPWYGIAGASFGFLLFTLFVIRMCVRKRRGLEDINMEPQAYAPLSTPELVV